MNLNCAEITGAVAGKIIQGDPQSFFYGVSIDSRTTKPGDLFVPLTGENADGHEYIATAFSEGATGCFTAKPLKGVSPEKNIIEVEDTLTALQKMAAYYRRKFNLQVVGITGSSGKTTTKDLVATVLGRHFNIHKTEGNFNNHIGLPLTTLKLKQEHEIAILEMAMRGPGEIALLTKIALPQWAIITNIGEAHIELLGSKDKIASAKGELLEWMDKSGTAILNGDDIRLRKLGSSYPGKVYYYGWNKDNHFRAFNYIASDGKSEFKVLFPDESEFCYELPVPGKHNVSNAVSALALGYLMGIAPGSMEFGLWDLNATSGRMNFLDSIYGIRVLDDTYNANPASMKASLEILKDMKVPGIKTAVLGDMLEIGKISEEAHREIGEKVAASGIKYLITVGKWAKFIAAAAKKNDVSVFHCDNNDEVWQRLQETPLSEGNVVLLKGSRGMKLEEVVGRLLG